MDLNTICHLSPAKKMKCSFLDYIPLLMISQARLVDGLEPHLPPLSSLKIKCSFLHYIQLLMIGRVSQCTQTPSAIPLQPKKWNACFWITLKFLWSAALVDGLEPHLPPLSSQQNEMLIFGLRSMSDDQPGYSINLNPICQLCPTKKMKCSFLDYVQLLMIAWAGRWTWTPSPSPLQPTKWNAHFCITFNFWWSVGLINGWPG